MASMPEIMQLGLSRILLRVVLEGLNQLDLLGEGDDRIICTAEHKRWAYDLFDDGGAVIGQ